MNKGKGLNDRVAEVERLYASGLSQREIAQMFDVSPGGIEQLMRRHGIQARPPGGSSVIAKSGDAHYLWKGDSAGYDSLHDRVNRRRGKPRHCQRCGTTDPAKRYDWANLTGNYADVDDYERMCRPCHRNYDIARRTAGGLSAAEAAVRAGVPLSTLRLHIKRGLIAARRVGSGMKSPYLITEQALADYLARRPSCR